MVFLVRMADDMINGLANMKSTAEEEEVIPVSEEGRHEEIESCTQSLIGKFLTCKPFNKRVALSTLTRVWGLEDSMVVSEVGSNLFQFKFQIEFDMEQILKEGLWVFDSQVLLLRCWEAGMMVKNVRFDSLPIWLQMWDALFDIVCSQVAGEVGRRLGRVVKVERRQGGHSLRETIAARRLFVRLGWTKSLGKV